MIELAQRCLDTKVQLYYVVKNASYYYSPVTIPSCTFKHVIALYRVLHLHNKGPTGILWWSYIA